MKATRTTTTRTRAPKGGCYIGTKFYRGGCFLPATATVPAALSMPSAAQRTKAPTVSVDDVVRIVRLHDVTGFNLVRLALVRTELALRGVTDRAAQDAVLFAARKAGAISLGAIEGRHGITAEDRDAAIRGTNTYGVELLGFVMVRN